MVEPAVEMHGISKLFPGVVANEHVDLRVAEGSVHALLGENGAGKTTLMKILSGLYRPDAGTIAIHGQHVSFRSPRDAIAAGIGMVHQRFRLVDRMTVAENLTIGMPSPRFLLDRPRLNRTVEALSDRYGLRVRPADRIWQLSVGEQQRVEILKQLYRGANILILDEPTAVLTPQESDELFEVLRSMAREGRTVIFITHKMREVMELADEITVLRAGRNVGAVRRSEATEGELVRLMVGRHLQREVPETGREAGLAVLELRDIHAEGHRAGSGLKGTSLELRAGEILGVAGVAGNGQTELAEVVSGLRPFHRGELLLDGTPVRHWTARKAVQSGVCYIPQDRHGVGSCSSLSVQDNLILRLYTQRDLRRGPLLDRRAVQGLAGRLVREFDIRIARLDGRAGLLSGGNLQRLILARELSTDPRVIVAHHPSFGLDVAAMEAVHDGLRRQRDAGAALLLISEDLDEIMSMSDRIAVMFEGQMVGVVGTETSRDQIGAMMAGRAGVGAGVA